MKKILIIEDDKAIGELERDYLEADGFTIDIAADGTAGLEKAKTNRYDLLILDVMLPGADGFEIIRAVRKDQDIPILMGSVRMIISVSPSARVNSSHESKRTWPDMNGLRVLQVRPR